MAEHEPEPMSEIIVYHHLEDDQKRRYDLVRAVGVADGAEFDDYLGFILDDDRACGHSGYAIDGAGMCIAEVARKGVISVCGAYPAGGPLGFWTGEPEKSPMPESGSPEREVFWHETVPLRVGLAGLVFVLAWMAGWAWLGALAVAVTLVSLVMRAWNIYSR